MTGKFNTIAIEEIEASTEVYAIWLDADGDYMAISSRYPLLSAFADTPAEALAELMMVIETDREIDREDLERARKALAEIKSGKAKTIPWEEIRRELSVKFDLDKEVGNGDG